MNPYAAGENKRKYSKVIKTYDLMMVFDTPREDYARLITQEDMDILMNFDEESLMNELIQEHGEDIITRIEEEDPEAIQFFEDMIGIPAYHLYSLELMSYYLSGDIDEVFEDDRGSYYYGVPITPSDMGTVYANRFGPGFGYSPELTPIHFDDERYQNVFKQLLGNKVKNRGRIDIPNEGKGGYGPHRTFIVDSGISELKGLDLFRGDQSGNLYLHGSSTITSRLPSPNDVDDSFTPLNTIIFDRNTLKELTDYPRFKRLHYGEDFSDFMYAMVTPEEGKPFVHLYEYQDYYQASSLRYVSPVYVGDELYEDILNELNGYVFVVPVFYDQDPYIPSN